MDKQVTPDDTVTHRRRGVRRGAVVLALLTGLLVGTGGTSFASHQFDDVPTSHPFHDDIVWLVSNDITEGFDDGTYRPNQSVTRGAMAAFLRRTANTLAITDTNRPFHLIVQCASATRFAVVNANGTLARGSAGTTSVLLGGGTYSVDFDINVNACAWTATVGLPGVGVTEGVASVAQISGNNSAVHVRTRV
jgi:hypothetical protein